MITDDDETIRCIFCPREIPSTCNAYNDYLTSCTAILTLFPKAISGYYNIIQHRPIILSLYIVIWKEIIVMVKEDGQEYIAYLNMTDSAQQCLPGFTLHDENGIISCGRQESSYNSDCCCRFCYKKRKECILIV